MADTVCIINPMAAGGRTESAWPALAAKLAEAGIEAEARFTHGPGDAVTQTRRALTEGARTIIAVGGDGTIHEVVNGFFIGDMAVNQAARLAILPAGSGSDLIKTLGIPRHSDGAVEVIAANHERIIDLGRVQFKNHAGDSETRRFINTASLGLSGAVIEQMASLPSFLKGALRYNLAAILGLATFKGSDITLTFNDDDPIQARLIILAVGNGKFFGGGMKIAPDAQLDDGELDMISVAASSLPKLLRAFVSIYSGTHVHMEMVESGRGHRLVVECATPQRLEIDGETPGVTPATFDIVPAAIRVLAPASKG